MQQGKWMLLGCLLFLFAGAVAAQDMAEPFENKELVIVRSTKSYADALATAQKAKQALGLKLDLRGLKATKSTGLTFSKADCESFGYPCYIARGRGDDGDYISIEYSSQYAGFAQGYYIVVIASGAAGDPLLKSTLVKAKKKYKDAYKKKSRVYVGCMH
jgi:hypothetical protein